MSFLDNQPLVFVDIETNGLDHIRGRIIEIAAIRVEKGEIVDEFVSLINPQSELPEFITSLTGIKSSDLDDAPEFADVAREIFEILDGAIFVAHNVRFDYSFIKQEFKRLGKPFLPTQLCTVKLSRSLYPGEKSHKLASLIDRHGLNYLNRHRAYDDAHVLWQFTQLLKTKFAEDVIENAIKKQIRRPAIPKTLELANIDSLPEATGVYIFEDESGNPLYVGKSTNIKKRVLQHFGADHDSQKEFNISQSVYNITTQVTSGELSALLLESRLVKEMQPLYNRQLRRLSKLTIAKRQINSRGYTQVKLDVANELQAGELSDILAIYKSKSKAQDSLHNLAETFNLCPKLLGLENSKNACFWHQLKKCDGACIGKESPENYNSRLETAFEHHKISEWPFKGAVLVKENSEFEDRASFGFVVDSWCVIAEITQQEFSDPVIVQRPSFFDLDAYKILYTYFSSKISSLSIQPLSQNQLIELGI